MYLTYLDIFNFLSESLDCQLMAEGPAVYIYTDKSPLNVDIIAGTLEGLLYSQDYNKNVEILKDNLIRLS